MPLRVRAWLAPTLLLSGAFLALLLPRLLDPWLATTSADLQPEAIRRRAHLGYALAGALLIAALALSGRRMLRDARTGALALGVVLAAGGIAAAAAALPHWDAAAAERIEAQYTDSQSFHSFPGGVVVGGIHAGVDGAPGFHHSILSADDTAAGPLDLGTFPVTKGDSWMIAVQTDAQQPAPWQVWRVDAAALDCRASPINDLDPAAPHGATFQCVATRSGETEVRILTGWSEPHSYAVTVAAVPTAYIVHGSWVDEAALSLGFAAALGAAAVSLACARRLDPAQARRAEALVAGGLAAASFVLAIVLLGRVPVIGTPMAPLLLVAAVGTCAGLALAALRLNRPERQAEHLGLAAAAVPALAALLAIPVVVPHFVPGASRMPFLLAAFAVVVLACAAGLRWSRPQPV